MLIRINTPSFTDCKLSGSSSSLGKGLMCSKNVLICTTVVNENPTPLKMRLKNLAITTCSYITTPVMCLMPWSWNPRVETPLSFWVLLGCVFCCHVLFVCFWPGDKQLNNCLVRSGDRAICLEQRLHSCSLFVKVSSELFSTLVVNHFFLLSLKDTVFAELSPQSLLPLQVCD